MSFLDLLTHPAILVSFSLVAMVVIIGFIFSKRKVTGPIVLAMAVAFFGLITLVNVVMANRAIATFPGLEVQNGYVASQGFDKRRLAQVKLGWTMTPVYKNGQLEIQFTDRKGADVQVDGLEVLVGRATMANEDSMPQMIWNQGGYEADLALASGLWMIKVKAIAPDGTLFEQRSEFIVKG